MSMLYVGARMNEMFWWAEEFYEHESFVLSRELLGMASLPRPLWVHDSRWGGLQSRAMRREGAVHKQTKIRRYIPLSTVNPMFH